jgi:anti-sigma factor RsiW
MNHNFDERAPDSADGTPATAACRQAEPVLPDYLDHTLPPAEAARIQAHLDLCPRCRTLATRLAELDAALVRSIKLPSLGSAFRSCLRQRLQAEGARANSSEHAERRRALQAEYEAQVAELENRSHWILWGLDSLGYLSIAVLACALVPALLPLGTPGQPLFLAGLAGGLCLLGGLAVAFRPQLRRWGWAV